jgi:hypothetical protein
MAIKRDLQGPFDFSLEDHLRVQREIEYRAHLLWRARWSGDALRHWLAAENAVLTEFVVRRLAAWDRQRNRTEGTSYGAEWCPRHPQPILTAKVGNRSTDATVAKQTGRVPGLPMAPADQKFSPPVLVEAK